MIKNVIQILLILQKRILMYKYLVTIIVILLNFNEYKKKITLTKINLLS